MRWEMQERRMMLAAAAAASTGFPGGPDCAAAAAPPTSVGNALTCPSYYHLLSPEARQRLVEGAAGEPPPVSAGAFETAAILQSAASWSFSSFGSGHYLSPTGATPPSFQASGAPTAADLRLHESEAAVAALNFREASSYYARERLSAERLEDESTTAATGLGYPLMMEAPPIARTATTMASSVGSTAGLVAKQMKKTKKPFTIENIIAPDDHQDDNPSGKRITDMAEEKKVVLSMPRPIYAAGFAMQPSLTDSAHQRPSYGTAT